jgi:hypothetical protein
VLFSKLRVCLNLGSNRTSVQLSEGELVRETSLVVSYSAAILIIGAGMLALGFTGVERLVHNWIYIFLALYVLSAVSLLHRALLMGVLVTSATVEICWLFRHDQLRREECIGIEWTPSPGRLGERATIQLSTGSWVQCPITQNMFSGPVVGGDSGRRAFATLAELICESGN